MRVRVKRSETRVKIRTGEGEIPRVTLNNFGKIIP